MEVNERPSTRKPSSEAKEDSEHKPPVTPQNKKTLYKMVSTRPTASCGFPTESGAPCCFGRASKPSDAGGIRTAALPEATGWNNFNRLTFAFPYPHMIRVHRDMIRSDPESATTR